MQRTRGIALAVVLLLAGQPVVSSASVDLAGGEDAAGADGPLLIETGSVPGVVDDGDLLIDAARGSAAGLAVDGRYTYGDPASPTTDPAFAVTNADDRPRDVSFAYDGTEGDGPAANVVLVIHDATGDRVATASEESGRVTVSGVTPGETLFVVVVVDTRGLTPAADLSGTLAVST